MTDVLLRQGDDSAPRPGAGRPGGLAPGIRVLVDDDGQAGNVPGAAVPQSGEGVHLVDTGRSARVRHDVAQVANVTIRIGRTAMVFLQKIRYLI